MGAVMALQVELVQAKAQGNPLIATEVALSLAAKGRLMVLASDGSGLQAGLAGEVGREAKY